MNKEEFTGEEMLEAMIKLRPEKLNDNTRKLFYTIMEVIDERDNLLKEKEKLTKQLDYALGILTEFSPPCEYGDFMDKHLDYCSKNCGADEEIFKKCWLMYIDEILERTDK